MRQIEFGFNVSNTIPFSMEVAFAQTHGFSFLQVWYDARGFSLYNSDPSDISLLQTCEIPLLIHALFDVSELETQFGILTNYLNDLELNEVVIHPVSIGNITTVEATERLCHSVLQGVEYFASQGITLYLENNSKLECLFQSIQDIEQVFTYVPQAELILDVAHIDDYEHLKQIIELKFPRILHVADRHLENTHEHLTIGDGNLDFKLIFRHILKKFSGRIIFEVPFESEARLRSKQKIEQILQLS